MTSIYVLATALLVSMVCAFTDGARRFGIGGLIFVILVSGTIWAAHIPLV
jgi:hypothetical protein